MGQIDSCQKGLRGGDWMKESEEMSQRTQMHGPYTQTAVWGWPEGRGQDCMEVSKGGNIGTAITVSTIKVKKKNKLDRER